MLEILVVPVSIYVFWLGFLVYAEIQSIGWTNVPIVPRILLAPPAAIFFLFDVSLNITAGSLVFLQVPWPKVWVYGIWELTLSYRLKRILNSCAGWRLSLAKLIVDNMLRPFTINY